MTPNLAAALLKFQADPPHIVKDAVNPHFRNRFASLEGLMETVRPALTRQGLVLMQFPSNIGGQPALRTKLIHAESGEEAEDVMLLMHGQDTPQAQGSALTYARRYALMSVLGLVADEDDDGDATRAGVPMATSTGRRPADRPSQPVDSATPAFSPPDSVTNRADPQDGGDPAKVVIHFSKNAGKELGELTPNQLKWYAETWEPRDGGDAQDRRLKTAAHMLHTGVPGAVAPPDDDIPF